MNVTKQAISASQGLTSQETSENLQVEQISEKASLLQIICQATRLKGRDRSFRVMRKRLRQLKYIKTDDMAMTA